MKPFFPVRRRLIWLLLCAFCIASVASAREFHISATGPLGDGSGSSAGNAADASTPERYRAINQAQNAPGTVIVYAPGTYRNSPAFSMFDGVTHRGAGVGKTIIQIAEGGAQGEFTPMWLADKPTISRFAFTDATIDFNATRNGWWGKGVGCSMAFAFSTADHCTLQRLRFIRMGAKKRESFPVFFLTGHSAKGLVHGNLIADCEFAEPVKEGNTDGLTCVMMADAQPGIRVDNTNVVTRCTFSRLKAPEYSDMAYTQCVTAPVVTFCMADGVDSLWFLEPGTQTLGGNTFFPGQTVQVAENVLRDCGPVALLLMHPNGHFAGTLSVENNFVQMTRHPYRLQGPRGPVAVSVEQYWPGDPAVGGMVVRGNLFAAPSCAPGLPREPAPMAVNANPAPGSGRTVRIGSLAVEDNLFANFPPDATPLNATVTPAPNPAFTRTRNTTGAVASEELAQRMEKHVLRIRNSRGTLPGIPPVPPPAPAAGM